MNFSTVAGQEKVKEILRKNILTSRLAHATLLYGKSGVGKLPLAIAAAQYIHCENRNEEDACGKCRACIKQEKLLHPDTHFVLPIFPKKHGSNENLTSDDFIENFRTFFKKNPYLSIQQWLSTLSQENKQLFITINDIRHLQKKAAFKPFESHAKVIIIWHIEKITNEAANSFLKFLEEPPPQTFIFLTAEDTTLLLPTILSRCQKIYVPGLYTQEIINYLAQNHEITPAKAAEIAALAQGSLSTAIEIQEVTTQPFSPIFMDWMRICYKGLLVEIDNWAKKMSSESKENQKLFLQFSIQKLREAFTFSILSDNSSPSSFLYLSQEEKKFFENFSKFLNLEKINKMFTTLEQHLYYLSRNANAYMLFYTLSLKLNTILK
ncbi:MAG: hypothetical protein RML72_02120 [Bacteroidia bacterium]|nr:hypothetical protein [Bacteroidia bacterium]